MNDRSFEGRLHVAPLVGEVARCHHEREKERLVAGVGGVVAGRDHRLQVGADAQVVREIGGWNNHITMVPRLRETRRRDHATSLAQRCTNRV